MEILRAALGAVVALAAAWLLLIAFLWLHRPSRELVGPAVRLIPDLVRLVRSLVGDRSVPLRVRLGLAGLLGYLLMPIDLVPDFLPVVGSADDLIIAAIVLRWAGRRIGLEGLRERWTGDPRGFEVLRRLLGV